MPGQSRRRYEHMEISKFNLGASVRRQGTSEQLGIVVMARYGRNAIDSSQSSWTYSIAWDGGQGVPETGVPEECLEELRYPHSS
jgi:hypothetical protein